MASDTTATLTHPIYATLQPTWELLQAAYRGDGGFLDGSALVAHPREIIYKRDVNGVVTTEVQAYKDKYRRRQSLARYENFARTIVDTFIAHLFAKSITRNTENVPGLEDWWEDVDGADSNIADHMQQQQALAMVYGHVVVLMDRETTDGPAVTRAQQGQPVLRVYSPLDVLDWIWDRGRYRALKVVEAVPRDDLAVAGASADADLRGGGDGAPKELTYVVWTETDWTRYDGKGKAIDSGAHGFGRVPAVIHRARPVPGMPSIGASTLGDPKLHRDHYNLVSELRELLRSQTFSMLNIQLGQDEAVEEARGRLGDAASVETVLWSKGSAGFIAPPEGPAAVYQQEIEALERKLYRMAGLPWEGDSAAAESADSRRLKAMDLNRLLAMYADEAERVEYQIAALWHTATTGETDPARVAQALDQVVIHYPDEFATIDTAQAAADVRDVVTMQLGPTATAEARKRAVPIVLPDLDQATTDTVASEIDQATVESDKLNQQTKQAEFRALVSAASPVKPGQQMADGEKDGGQIQDAGARA
jgi:hypothetical protein